MLAFVVGLRAEARLVSGAVFTGGGDGPGAACAARRAVEAGATALVSFGLAGGLSPALSAGAVLVARSVLSRGVRLAADPALGAALGGFSAECLLAGETVVADAASKTMLWNTYGTEAVDLESGAVAEAAMEAALPFGVLRAVCDPAWRTLPPAALAALDGAGRVGLPRVLGSLLRRPGQIGGLLALARDAGLARQALRRRMAVLLETDALKAWSV